MSTVKVYEYGCAAPRSSADVVSEQMHRAHVYYNQLVEIEQAHRIARETALRQDPDYAAAAVAADALETRLAEVRNAIKEDRQAEKSNVPTPVKDEEARSILQQLRVTWPLVRTLRLKARKANAIQAALSVVNAENKAAQIAARAACGCYWGTYLIVEQAMESARKAIEPPRFHRWDGSGHVAVQIQHGMSVEDLHGCQDTRIRIERPEPWNTRAEAQKRKRVHAQIRIASDDERRPVWADLDVYLHRPLPTDGKIRWVHLLRELIAGRERWKIQFTVESSILLAAPPSEDAIALDLGWAQVDGGLCSGICTHRAGRVEEIVLPEAITNAITKADALRWQRDRWMEGTLPVLAAWIKEHAAIIPPDLAEFAATVAQWKSQARLAGLWRRWRAARFAEDDEAWTRLDMWHTQDHHLWQWEVNQRDKAIRWRREFYRTTAARYAELCGALVVSSLDLRALAARPAPEEDPDVNETARGNRVLAAASILRTCFVQAFQTRGRRVIKAKGRASEALASGEVVLDSPEPLATSNVPQGRWKKRKDAKR